MIFETNAALHPLLTIPVKLTVKADVLAKPEGLDHTVSGNDVQLFWEAPSSKGLLGYNIYQNGEKVNTSVVAGTSLTLENLAPGSYFFQVTALYTDGESNPEGDPLFVFLTEAAAQNVQITGGWSGISSYIVPLDPAVEAVFAPVADDLVIVLGNAGMYWPGQSINTLQNWDNEEGYKIKMSQPQNLLIEGNEMPLNAVNCDEGWNLIPVLSSCAVSPADIFAYGLENLVIIKEVASTSIYWPTMGIFSLQELLPGKSYEMYLTGDASLLFPECEGTTKQGKITKSGCTIPWDYPVQTGFTHTIAITGDAVSQLLPGDVIGVFNAENVCTGFAQIEQQPFTLTVFADDQTTAGVDGMMNNEWMNFRLYRPDEDKVYNLEVAFMQELPQEQYFVENGMSAIDEIGLLQVGLPVVSVEQSIEIFPNPSTGRFFIHAKNAPGQIHVTILSAFGETVFQSNLFINGSDSEINLTNMPEGVYFVKTSDGSSVLLSKLIITR